MLGYRSLLLGVIVLGLFCLPSQSPATERLRAAYAALNASQSPLWTVSSGSGSWRTSNK